MNIARMAWRLARRDLRGGLGELWILVAGIALGVALMAAVGSLAGGALEAMKAGARQAVGGDISLRLFHAPPTPEQRAFLETLGTISVTAELRTRVGGRLAEVKAVDGLYPLVGAVDVAPGTLADALALRDGTWGAVADPDLSGRLRLGATEVEVRAALLHEPDRSFRAFSLGPRLIVAAEALEASGLAETGAPVYWYIRLRLPDGADPRAALAAIEQRFPDAPWRMVNAADGVPGVERTLDIARTLFVLTGLGILLIGGVGVGAAVRAAVEARRATIATLKALGASRRLVFFAILAQVGVAAVVAVALGLAVGAGMAAVVGQAVTGGSAVHGPALAAAGGVGLLAVLLFALPPLASACAARPPETWRGLGLPRPGWRVGAVVIGIGVLLAAVLVAWTGMAMVALAFAVGAAGLAALLRLLAGGVAWMARRQARRARGPRLRLAWANLGRPEAPTVPVGMAFGLGVTLLVAVAAVGVAALRHVEQALPESAPALLVLNLQPEEAAAVTELGRAEAVPFLHARISRLNGEPVTERAVPRSVAWAVRGDRGVSWRSDAARGDVVAGRWWPTGYDGPPLAAVDARVAGRLGLKVGDTLTLAMPHGSVTAPVAVLRRMDWVGLDLDFPVWLSPPPEVPPHTYVAALWEPPAGFEETLAALAPEAPVVQVADVLDALSAFVSQVRRALLAVAGVALVAAGVVLAGAVASSLRRRRREAAVLHAVGVGRGPLASISALEFALLGAMVAAFAVPAGLVVAVGVVRSTLPDAVVAVPVVLPLVAACGAVALLAAVGAAVAVRPPAVRALVAEAG